MLQITCRRAQRRLAGRVANGLAAGAMILLAGCHGAVAPARDASTRAAAERAAGLNPIADEYVRLALALGERDPDSLDFTTAPVELRDEEHRRYRTLDEIAREAAGLLQRLQERTVAPGDTERSHFLRLQLEALAARVQMLSGHVLPFDDEARVLFATTRMADEDAGRRAAVRTRVGALLAAENRAGAPKGETLADRLTVYESRFSIPSSKLETVMHAALGACRRSTLKHMSLPANESVELTFVRDRPWSAFSLYEGKGHSLIEINLDNALTVDDALELACHEAYPGHHVFNLTRDVTLAQQGRSEAQVQPTFSPQSYVSEAAAAYAPRMAFSPQEREQVEREVLFPATGLDPAAARQYVTITNLARELDSAEPAVAEEYLDGDLEFARATQRLASEALLAHAEPLLLYLNEYRSYMLAYTDGPRRVAAYVEADSRTGPMTESDRQRLRWARYTGLMREMRFDLDERTGKAPGGEDVRGR